MRLQAKVGPKGQAVIPKPVRDELGIRPGDTVYFSTHGEHAHVDKKSPEEALDEFFESLPTIPGTSDLDAKKIKRILDEQFEEEYQRFHA